MNNMNPNQTQTMTQGMVTRRPGLHKQLTGSQLVMIMSLREDLGMPKLTSHNISCLSIDAASRMIDDLMIFRDTLEANGIIAPRTAMQSDMLPQEQPPAPVRGKK